MTVTRRAVHSLGTLWMVALAACGGGSGPPATELRFWAMGREGEVVQQLLPAFEQRPPRRARPRPADPVERGAREAADGVRRRLDARRLSGGYHLDARVGGARRRAAEPRRPRPTATSSPASPRPTGSTVAPGRRPGTSTLACCSIGPTCLRAAGWDAPPPDWTGWEQALDGLKRLAGSDRYALLLPLDEWQPPVILAFQRGARLLRGDDEWGDFRADAFRSAFMFYLSFFQRGLAPAGLRGRSPTSTRTLPPDSSASSSPGRGTSASSPRACRPTLQESWATAPMPGDGPDAPGVSIAGGASLAIAADTPHADAARDAGRLPHRRRAAARVLPAERRPAGAAVGVDGGTSDRRSARRRLLAAAPTRRAAAPHSGVGAHRRRHRPRRRGGGARRSHRRRRRWRSSIARSTTSSRSGGGCWNGRDKPRMTRSCRDRSAPIA